MNITDEQENALLAATAHAGDAAMAIYERDYAVAEKSDQSPVTEADLVVDKLISSLLTDMLPDVPIVTEEQGDTHVAMPGETPFFLVDPIDGTKEFINKTGEFTINIALIVNRTPAYGIVYAPAAGRMFVGAGKAFEICDGARKQISVANCDGAMKAVASRSHSNKTTQGFLDDHAITDTVSAGSSLKFCLLAAGEADVYPRFGPTMEWDTAAGHAVLVAAGGMVLLEDGSPLLYAKPDYRNPNFIACSPDARRKCRFAA